MAATSTLNHLAGLRIAFPLHWLWDRADAS